jgi:hypothetical protein
MFKPTNQIKKILGKYGNYAYIYNDGVIVVEKREIKVSKDNYSTLNIWHILPCDTKIRVIDYANHYNSLNSIQNSVRCLVIHDGNLIANGFSTVEVAFNAGSPGTTEKSIVINQVNFTNDLHCWRALEMSENKQIIYSSGITIQPNPYDKWSPRLEDVFESIRSGLQWQDTRGYSVIVYGDLPEKKKVEENRLLTVSN